MRKQTETAHGKKVLITKTNSEGSGEPAHLHKPAMARAFEVSIQLRNFHISDIHRGINAMCHVKRKWRPNFNFKVNFEQEPLCSYLDECQKNEIHILYLH